MAINLDLTGVDPSQVGKFQNVAPGQAHVIVTDAVEYGGKHQEHVVKVVVLAHSDPKQVGRQHQEYFPAAADMAWKLLEFAYATELTSEDAMTAAKAAGQSMAPIDLAAAVGRQLFCTFKQTEKKGEIYINMNKMVSLRNTTAERHPRDAAALARAIGSLPPASSAPVIPAQQAPVTPAPGAGTNPFGALAASRTA